jgi:hypothetical protein
MVWWACVIANLIGVSIVAWAIWTPRVAIGNDTSMQAPEILD